MGETPKVENEKNKHSLTRSNVEHIVSMIMPDAAKVKQPGINSNNDFKTAYFLSAQQQEIGN
jgi:hypothetical protein